MFRAGAIAAGLALVAACTAPDLPMSPAPSTVGVCEITRVIDGDTADMRCDDTGPFRARLTGFDTPEVFSPGCRAEQQLGMAATSRLRQLVAAATHVDVRFGGVDRYGRRLVRLRLDGTDVGSSLVREGLAVRYSGGPRIDWCQRLGA